jgi:hypothetical protein
MLKFFFKTPLKRFVSLKSLAWEELEDKDAAGTWPNILDVIHGNCS